MKRADLIKSVQRYFSLQELVDKQTLDKYGEFAWHFFDSELLETLIYLREQVLKVPMTVNNWSAGGSFSQRGLRHNLSQLVQDKTKQGRQYMTAHGLGRGVDFDAKGMTADKARMLIKAAAYKLPYPIRLEDGVNWVHVDLFNDGSKSNVELFKA